MREQTKFEKAYQAAFIKHLWRVALGLHLVERLPQHVNCRCAMVRNPITVSAFLVTDSAEGRQ